MAKSLFKSRKTSCFLMYLTLAMSFGNRRVCSTASATYPAMPTWKSQMEASHGRGAPFSSKGGAQVEVATWCSPLLFVSWADLVCMPLGYLNPLWGSTYWEEWVFPGSIASLPLSSLFLLWSIGSARVCWVGGGVGSRVWFWGMGGRVWAAFSDAFPPSWDLSNSWRVDLSLRWIPISSETMMSPWRLSTWIGESGDSG